MRPSYSGTRPDPYGHRMPHYLAGFYTERYGYPPAFYAGYVGVPYNGYGYVHSASRQPGSPGERFYAQSYRPRRPYPYPNPYYQPDNHQRLDPGANPRTGRVQHPSESQRGSTSRRTNDQTYEPKPVLPARRRRKKRGANVQGPSGSSETQPNIPDSPPEPEPATSDKPSELQPTSVDSSSEEEPVIDVVCQTPEPASSSLVGISSSMIITPYRTMDDVDYNLRGWFPESLRLSFVVSCHTNKHRLFEPNSYDPRSVRASPLFKEEKLIHQLRHGQYQCLICISRVRQRDPIWSCSTCFHIYHLSCIKSWAEKCKATATGEQSDVTSQACWRCPACQTKQVCDEDGKDQPLEYICFCGRVRNPEYHPARTSIPHGCDEMCGKLRTSSGPKDESTKYLRQTMCTHPCTELCHPGPCPPCVTRVSMTCPCGRIQQSMACGDAPPAPCGQLCSQSLSETGCSCACGTHVYMVVTPTTCFCGREEKTIICGSEDAKKIDFTPGIQDLIQTAYVEFQSMDLTKIAAERSEVDMDSSRDQASFLSEALHAVALSTPVTNVPQSQDGSKSVDTQKPLVPLLIPPVVKLGSSFSCSRTCGKQLSCGNHTCADPCHSGDCKPCSLEPSRCFTCPCGRVALSKLVLSGDVSGDRTSCVDPVPLCPNVCARPHSMCGHPCPLTCHSGPCPPCELSTTAKCRCGRTSKELTCARFEELARTEGLLQMLCERICKRKKVCGRHKCKNKCCDLTAHSCSEICGRRLTCQRHNCEEPCHPGPCATCWRGVIYTELYCRCGLTVLPPPQPCGSIGPECVQPCNRVHDCDHPVRHTCHNDPICPPCTVLLTKECPGGHGVQFSMPCFQPVLSCGRACGKRLPRCSHTCQRPCHVGDCIEPSASEQAYPCSQPCKKLRPDCGHPCKLPCHEAKGQTCLQAALAVKRGTHAFSGRTAAKLPPCQHRVDIVCSCGRRKDQQACHQNPADLASRGIKGADDLSRWMYGPEFINEPKIVVSPLTPDRIPDGVELKASRATINVIFTRSVSGRLFARWSSLFVLLKSVAWLRRFIHYIMHKFGRSVVMPFVGHLQVKELTEARVVVIRQVQAEVYSDESIRLKADTQSEPTKVSALRKLCPILLDGVLCVQSKLYALALQEQSSGEPHRSFKLKERTGEPLKLLVCDDTCTKAELTSKALESRYADTLTWKRDAQEGLLVMPDTEAADDSQTSFEPPEYSDFLRQYALSNFAFAVGVERQFYSMLTELWKPTEKQGAPPVRVLNHHFPPMNKKRRRFIRELAEFYGMECYTFDPEPSRHVMVLAKRGEARLPGRTSDHRACLTNSLQRDFKGTVHVREGIRVPKKPEKKTGLPPPSTMGMSYAQVNLVPLSSNLQN
ncbi:NF-X1 type zinc finger, partial [Opisthorchis viverrini]